MGHYFEGNLHMYNITLWHIHVTTVAMEMQQYIVFIVVITDAAVNNLKVLSAATEMQHWVTSAAISYCC
jgi:hypothetical protein